MSNIDMTQHGARRCSQRAMSNAVLQAIIENGVEVEGGYLLTEKAAREQAALLRRKADLVERAAGKRVVVPEGRLVTAYHTTRKKQRELVRSAEMRNLKT